MFLIKSQQYNRNPKFDKMLKIIHIRNVINNIINTLYTHFHKFNIRILINQNIILMFLKVNVNKINNLMLKQCYTNILIQHISINKQQKIRL